MDKATKVYYFVMVVIFTMIGFFSGSVVEQTSHAIERAELVYQRDSIQILAEYYESNTDYKAMFSLKAKEVTANCNECAPILTDIQSRLDSIEKWKGKLVVPRIGRSTK